METDSLIRYLAVVLLANNSVTSCLRTRAQMFVTFKALFYIPQSSSSCTGTVLKSLSHVNRIRIVHITWQLFGCVVNFILLTPGGFTSVKLRSFVLC
jgi:hypothetical protein